MAKYFVRMPSIQEASLAMPMFDHLGPAARPRRPRALPEVLVTELDDEERSRLEKRGATIYPDIQFAPFVAPFDIVPPNGRYWQRAAQNLPMLAAAPRTMKDVMSHINALDAWRVTRGGGVTIAVVDTGVCGSMLEFPAEQRSPVDLPSAFHGHHWADIKGHGSMCAAIAGGTTLREGRYDGVAPDATLLSARTDLSSTDIFNIYDALIDHKRRGSIEGPLVISNSYGLYTCTAPNVLPADHPYMDIVLTAIAEGIVVVFAAGNNHYDVLCNNDPTQCSPNTIWAANSHEKVLSVGTVNEANSNRDPATPHANSSRGPGQWSGDLPKPDCVAPTYGEVVWGCGYRQMDWWGTSGACPQVAGLAALMLSVNVALSPARVGDIIRATCHKLGAPEACVGSGLIDCSAAVQAALTA